MRLFLTILLLNTLLAAAQTGHWQVVTTANDVPNRSECGLAAVNDTLYLIGGDEGQPLPVEAFDTKTLTWTTLAVAPVPMHHFQAVAYDNKIYVLEAFDSGGFPNQAPMANVYAYDIKSNKWQKGGAMPAARRRAGAGAAEYRGKLYLVDGIQHGHSSGTTNMFDVYDPRSKRWDSLPDAPHIRDHCSATVVGNKLYVVGGRNTSFRDPDNKLNFFSQTVLDVDCYDFITRTWSTLPAKLPLGSGGGAVVNLDDVLYYMGGERATATEPNAPRKNTYYLDLSAADKWIETDTLHFARNGMAAVAVNNQIYVAGGSGGGPGTPMPRGSMPPVFNPNMPPPQDSSHHGFPPPGMGGRNPNDKIKIEVFELN